MSAEMQMFIFTPFFLIPVWYINKYVGPRVALAFSSLYTIAATIVIIVQAYNKEWGPSIGL